MTERMFRRFVKRAVEDCVSYEQFKRYYDNEFEIFYNEIEGREEEIVKIWNEERADFAKYIEESLQLDFYEIVYEGKQMRYDPRYYYKANREEGTLERVNNYLKRGDTVALINEEKQEFELLPWEEWL